MEKLPNLAGVATQDLVEQIGAGNFKASYINWSRTMNLLREHAPGWLPELIPSVDGGIVHTAPVGAFLLIRFRNGDDVTPSVPQAIMDNRNNAIPIERVTARDITDTHRRGVCMAAAFTFGLAYELWAKMPLESGYAGDPPKADAVDAGRPADGAWAQASELGWGQQRIEEVARIALEYWEAEDVSGAAEYLAAQGMPHEAKIALGTMFDSKFRAALKKHAQEQAAQS